MNFELLFSGIQKKYPFSIYVSYNQFYLNTSEESYIYTTIVHLFKSSVDFVRHFLIIIWVKDKDKLNSSGIKISRNLRYSTKWDEKYEQKLYLHQECMRASSY